MMNDVDSPATAAADPQQSDPPSTGAPPAPDSWIDRLKAAVGLKPAGTIREDLADALATGDQAGGGFTPEERAMLANILRLRDVRVDDIMVPRADIDAVEIGTSLGELLVQFEKSGHSRMPVYRETLDEPVGLVHIKDLMSYVARAATEEAGRIDLARIDLAKPLGSADLVRDILFVPPSMPVTALLDAMQASHMQLALVIDEYGGTDGLVSLEDAVEMVVGDIEDEHDDEEGPMIAPDGDGAFVADARAALDEVSAAVGTDFAPGEEGEDIDTIGGLVISLLGRVPVRGELVALPGGLEAEILDADPRRIRRLRLDRRPAESPRPEPRRRTRAVREEPDDSAA